jgi:quinol monooxygenase YgiN
MGRIVIAAYRPRPGKQAELRALMNDHLPQLRAEGLATDRASILMEAADGTVIEVFEWVSKEAIEAAHENPVVLAMWAEYAEVCDFVPAAEVQEINSLFSEFSPLA